MEIVLRKFGHDRSYKTSNQVKANSLAADLDKCNRLFESKVSVDDRWQYAESGGPYFWAEHHCGYSLVLASSNC